ncbi:MAG: insulinase family protein [Clostridia bacterium]|nr:insulinase family protein [Clostridia bacterium]MBQ5685645.1 insulinase family protein [Clostridia bacterium]
MDNTFVIHDAEPGFRVCSYHTDRFKTGILSVNLVVPLAGNVAEKSLLPSLLCASCAEYPDLLSLNRRLAELYGAELTPSASKHGENLVLRITMTMIGDRFALDGESISVECARLLCKALFEPNVENGAFRPDEVAREKRIRLDRIEALKSSKRAWAQKQMLELMCADEAYSLSVLGEEEDISALTPEQLYASWQDLLKTAFVQLQVVGDLEVEPITALFREYFDRVEDRHVVRGETVVIPFAKTVKRGEEEQDIAQSKLVMGFRCGMHEPFENYAAMRTFTDLFGGGTYSRLFMNVREKQSLCYYCAARLTAAKGILTVQSGVETENAERAEKEILKQLDEMKAGGVTAEDLEKSKRSMEDFFLSVFDTPEELDGWLFSQVTDDEFQTPEDLVADMKEVTVEQVIEMANNISLDTVFLLKGTGTGGDGEVD